MVDFDKLSTMIKAHARKLRSEGVTLNRIVRELNIPKTTVWGWIKDVELTDEQRGGIKSFGGNRNKAASQKAATSAMVEKYERLKQQSIQIGHDYVLSFESLPVDLVAGTMLYWAEGSKTQNLAFANSDKDMVKLFMGFMLKHLRIEKDHIRVHLSFYDSVHTQNEVEDFWLDFLGVPRCNLYKSQVNKKPQATAGGKIGKLPFGVCTISQSSKYKRYEMDGMIRAVFDRITMAA